MKSRTSSALRRSIAAALLLGCVNTVTISAAPDAAPVDVPEVLPADTGPAVPPADAGPIADGGAPTPDAATPDGTVVLPPGVSACNGGRCAAGQGCCYGTGRCYDLATPSACPMPSRTTNPRACASDAQCAATEQCASSSPSGLCVGIGTCEPRRMLSDCGSGTEACGCDGQFWPSSCAASQAGVRGHWNARCGEQVFPSLGHVNDCNQPGTCDEGYSCDLAMHRCVADHPIIACATDAHCPSGQFCCAHTGLCVTSSDRELCRAFPGDSFIGCRTNADCLPIQRYQGLSRYYCAGEGCGTVGACTRLPSDCSGELAPVCGCDGRSYTNACAAGAAMVRVAHPGACP